MNDERVDTTSADDETPPTGIDRVDDALTDRAGLVAIDAVAAVTDVAPPPDVRQRRGLDVLAGDVVALLRERSSWVGLGLTLLGAAIWAIVFTSLGVRNHRNFGTWAYDMAIYDQAFWLVSRGGQTFMTVRGMDVWGHHLNLVAYLFAPFYRWLGAGPEFLYVVQNVSLALGAVPVYLIAKLRFGGSDRWWSPYVGLAFAVAYLLYAPAQFIAWINFHPEAMVITPFLFAWYFAMRRRWGWFFTFVVLALAMREDVALAVIMLGVVLLVVNRNSLTRRRDLTVAAATVLLGVVWYVVATQVIIRHFNDGQPPFYLTFFYQRYGGTFRGIVESSVRHPNRVVSDALQPDRIRFYRDLTLPLGFLPVASPLHLLMAAPQLLASVIGDSPYARQIIYQYTSVMVAPIFIAGIEGARNLWRLRWLRRWLIPWLLVCAYATNVAWSPSPIGDRYGVWARENPRRETLDAAVALVPDDASVSSSYAFGPHLAHRTRSYDWPNPFYPAYWGNEGIGRQDCARYPSASDVDYVVLDRTLFAADPNQSALIDGLVAEDGQFEVLLDRDGVLVARRITPGPDGERLAPNCPGSLFDALLANEVEVPPTPTNAPLPTTPPVTAPPPPSGDPGAPSTTAVG